MLIQRLQNTELEQQAVETTEETEEEDVELLENSWRYQDGELIVGEWEAPTVNSYSHAWEKVDGSYRNDNGDKIRGARKRGIDVSYHNGTINWKKVKNDDSRLWLLFVEVMALIRKNMMTVNGKRM